ncbi:hypothetical protein KIL84_012129 [Mauremys mutica]|uniref:Uncharacterized protein n=1 Tax=Mauremys mutica TaxID=74926 RepID=A0A9D3XEZ1_9SAUR|nr:hypothetical protein KIL84_012129 [Mauremys mutica]
MGSGGVCMGSRGGWVGRQLSVPPRDGQASPRSHSRSATERASGAGCKPGSLIQSTLHFWGGRAGCSPGISLWLFGKELEKEQQTPDRSRGDRTLRLGAGRLTRFLCVKTQLGSQQTPREGGKKSEGERGRKRRLMPLAAEPASKLLPQFQ